LGDEEGTRCAAQERVCRLFASFLELESGHQPLRYHREDLTLGLLRGFDHGVGHSLLLLYDAKTPHGQKTKEFNGLDYGPSNASTGLF